MMKPMSGFIAQLRDLVLGLLHLLEHAGKRLFDDRCMQVAASLSFTTILSLVPFLAISLSFISAFSQFADVRAEAELFITQNLLPQAGEAAVEQFRSFVAQTQKLTGLGIVAVAVTALLMLATINNAFDVIWRVQRPRPLMIRFLAYWAIITLAPLLVGAALSASGILMSAGESGRRQQLHGLCRLGNAGHALGAGDHRLHAALPDRAEPPGESSPTR